MTSKGPRYPVIDVLRGLAIVLMFFFHFSYDLHFFNYINIDFYRDFFWYALPRLIVFMFLFCVGLSMPLSHFPNIVWRSFWRRFGKIAGGALAISVGTYFLFPDRWIYFGTLHCISLCSILGIFFLRYPKTSLVLGLALFFPSFAFHTNIPWFHLPHSSMDYISPFPWFGATLMGIFAFHQKLHHFPIKEMAVSKGLSFLGRHSLIIYLVHQPILFALVWAWFRLTS